MASLFAVALSGVFVLLAIRFLRNRDELARLAGEIHGPRSARWVAKYGPRFWLGGGIFFLVAGLVATVQAIAAL